MGGDGGIYVAFKDRPKGYVLRQQKQDSNPPRRPSGRFVRLLGSIRDTKDYP